MFGWNSKREQVYSRLAMANAAVDGFLITGQSGLMKGTHVPSNLGWKRVETLKVGDKVLTFDHGMQPIVDIQRETLVMTEGELPDDQLPLKVPAGALYNRRELWLMPEQGMLVESDAANDAMGDPYAVLPARMLSGFRGIERGQPGDRIELTTIAFRGDQVIYVEGGMLAYCPAPKPLVPSDGRLVPAPYEVLDGSAARYLVDTLIDSDDAHALASNPAELPSLIETPQRPTRPLSV